MKLVPLEDKVLVEPTKKEEKIGCIYLPDQGKQESGEAIVVAVGDLVKNVKVGDLVVTEIYGGKRIKVSGKEYRLYRNEDIFGIVKND